VARLFGLQPPALETCRILELGCGDGSHLIPIALTLPGSRSVGADLARAPVEAGRKIISGLHLGNVVLHQLDLRKVDESFGQFDYIIAHGLYSWAPPETRDRLLAICGTNLAPDGIAFVSYNTYPGCHMRDMMRQMLLYQTRGLSDPELKLKHAYALINFLASSAAKPPALAEEVESLQSRSASALFHDDLAETNQPVYFHQFAEHAGRHGLEYVGEAEFKALLHGGLSDETARTLKLVSGGDRIQEQQYLDFLRCRRFRQTLLCRRPAALPERPDAGAVMHLRAASSLQPVSDGADAASDAEAEFRSPAGHTLKTNLPLAKAVLFSLSGRWPASVAFGDLAAEVALRLAGAPGDTVALAELLLRLSLSGVVELHALPPSFTLEVSARPRAFRLARLQAAQGRSVTTLRHTTVDLEDDLSRWMVSLLDGTKNRRELQHGLEAFAAGRDRPGAVRAEELERNLHSMARLALLEA